MVKNGSIIMWKNHHTSKGLVRLVENAIEFFSGSPYVHVAIVLFNKVYSYGAWLDKNHKLRQGLIIQDYRNSTGDELYEPVEELPIEAYRRMEEYCLYLHDKANKYNFIKLLFLSIIYPFRGIFRALNWVPFDKEKMGDVCSVLPAEAYERAGIDFFPNDPSGYTTPGMWLTLVPEKFVKKERS